MGGKIDALKLVSSITLFCAAAQSLVGDDPIFAFLVESFASLLGETTAQGYLPCSQTLKRVNNIRGPGTALPGFTD